MFAVAHREIGFNGKEKQEMKIAMVLLYSEDTWHEIRRNS
jgi:hypothetical protein